MITTDGFDFGLQPYNFEPEFSDSEIPCSECSDSDDFSTETEDDRSESSIEEYESGDGEQRLSTATDRDDAGGGGIWCTCKNCVEMASSKSHVCLIIRKIN